MGVEYYLVDYDKKEYIHLGKPVWNDQETDYISFQMPDNIIVAWMVKRFRTKLSIIPNFTDEIDVEEEGFICDDRWFRHYTIVHNEPDPTCKVIIDNK